MIKNILMVSVIGMTVILPIMAWKASQKPKSTIKPVTPVAPIKPNTTIVVPELVKEINARNEQINSISSDQMNVKVWENGMRFRLKGSLYYEKQNNFRMKISSIFGKEIDLGSNDEIFWFWSRRNTREGLFYAKHEDYQRTRLKTPFNPIFIKASLGLDQIDVSQSKIFETDENLIIADQFLNSMGKLVYRYTFINKANRILVGYLLTNTEGKPIAISEILGYSGPVPQKILYTWFEENKILFIDLGNIRYNRLISSENWLKPNHQPQINMGEQ